MIKVKFRVRGVGRTFTSDNYSKAWVVVTGLTFEECEETAKRAFSMTHDIDYYSISLTYAYFLEDAEVEPKVLEIGGVSLEGIVR